MTSRRPTLPQKGHFGVLIRPQKLQRTSICPFCSVSPPVRPRAKSRRDVISRRFQSTKTANSTNPRKVLEQTLVDLQKLAPAYVNLSRFQLALQGLRRVPGEEVVRVAILSLANDADAATTAKTVLRALLADPLSNEEEWERELKAHDPRKPLIVRVGPNDQQTRLVSRRNLLHEVHASSAELNNLNLEILFMEINSPATSPGEQAIQATEEALLVPTIDIPSAENRVTPVTTPVHKTLLVANGLMGAVRLTALSIIDSQDTILRVVDMKGVDKNEAQVPFTIVEPELAVKGIERFREGPQHAMEYEKLWFASNVPALRRWLQSGIQPSESTKPAVRRLIASLLQNTLATIQSEESSKLAKVLNTETLPPAVIGSLNQGLAEWSQKAHAELQDELDLAFTGRRWSKLGWWQLFWRVDDVAMLTNEMLSQRFLPTSEAELIYLTGRVSEKTKDSPEYPQPASSKVENGKEPQLRRLGSGELAPMVLGISGSKLPKWPGHIAFTRRYLQNETVPALQALAQNLVMQSLGTSGLTTSLAALLYISQFSGTIYEAGAVAALGIVWSMRRLQNKWETARSFWEGEVREEGRKAVRGAEESVASVLEGRQPDDVSDKDTQELERARELVQKAEDALARMK